tara:strand:+ start:75 stop:239 length:165 start_codon:yes stop_codon:yes gene_type:complete
MNKYKMTVTEIVTCHYFIDADSEDDARNWRGEVTDRKEIWDEGVWGIEDIEEIN